MPKPLWVGIRPPQGPSLTPSRVDIVLPAKLLRQKTWKIVLNVYFKCIGCSPNVSNGGIACPAPKAIGFWLAMMSQSLL